MSEQGLESVANKSEDDLVLSEQDTMSENADMVLIEQDHNFVAPQSEE